jgi:hypothetical protein
MNEFRTSVRLVSSPLKIGLKHRIMTLGSCFSDAIGARLERHKFSVSVNPFGIIYNPLSLHRIFAQACRNEAPDERMYIQNDDVHLHFDLHSSLSALDRTSLQKKVGETISDAHEFLKNTSWVLITYGTAWVFTHRKSGSVVANCHKQPSQDFDKSLLTADQIVESFRHMHQELRSFNPRAKVILTVSPVRHIKDTLQLNSVSKSVLRVACHEISTAIPDVEYFPAYEIMMDDLRDYRFYKADMIHPTEQAEDYIWNSFVQNYMDSSALDFIQQWKSIHPALQHRPFHPASSGHQIFLRQTLHKLEQLQGVINVDAEILSIQKQLLDSRNSNQTPS